MYFSKFPVVRYPIKSDNTFRFVLVRNILRRIGLSDSLKGVDGAFIEYSIKDGERPEHIADKLYGDPQYHWLVLLTNEIVDPYHGWYKSDSVLSEYIQKKYRGNYVYFTQTNDSFLYSTLLFSGATLVQGSLSSSVKEYHPSLCRVVVDQFGFGAGSATVRTKDGSTTTVKIHRVDEGIASLHHFEVQKTALDYGAANTTATVDPFSQQTGSYSYAGGVAGASANEYPDPQTSDGLNYNPSGLTLPLWNTYIGRYMGISGSAVNTFTVTNRGYEFSENDKTRTIKLLHPRFKTTAVQELESLLRV